MFDVKKYWKARRDMEKTLEECTYITSVGDETRGLVAGSVCGADRETAARCLVEGTHRKSTDEEIAKFHAECEARTALCKSMTDARGNKTVLTVDADLASKLRLKGA
jgi:hypothetical protein